TRARDHLIVPVAAAPHKAGPMLLDLLPSLPPPGADPETVIDGAFVVDGATIDPLPDDAPPLPDVVASDVLEAALEERAAWEAVRTEVVHAARAELKVIPATRDEGEAPVAALLGADDAPLI